MRGHRIKKAEIGEVLAGKTVFVPLPDGGSVKLMMRRRMIYIQRLTERDTIAGKRRPPAGEAAKGLETAVGTD